MDVKNTKFLYNIYSGGKYKVSIYAESGTDAYIFARQLDFILFDIKFSEDEEEILEDLYEGYRDFDCILAAEDDIDRQDLNILN